MIRSGLIAVLALATMQEGPSGTPAQRVHYKIAPNFNKPDNVDLDTLLAARKSEIFGARYAAALVQLHKALAQGNDFEHAWLGLQTLLTQPGPAGAPEHLKALSTALKEAVVCKACTGGRVGCEPCKGTKYRDVDCQTCGGKGRFRRTGDGVGSDMMCPKCNGKKIFTGCPCPDCKSTGTVRCETCRGRPWMDKCLQAGCDAGRKPCPNCKAGVAIEDCATCGGQGRRPTKNAGWTIRCDACNQTGKLPRECKNCNKTGRLPCETCSGTGRNKLEVPLEKLYETESCDACSGSGWPDPKKAVACAKCVGLGVRLKPAGAPDRMLD